ncbi:MAG TPA: DUF542 domain-containing protein [Flavobacteriaceae bacterium]|nr:DUF542 domain-containing protein [Flavobacteriaceae bacterium]
MNKGKITIGQVVAEDYRTAKAFQKFDIDFCNEGRKSLKAAADDKNIQLKNLWEEIERSKLATQIRPNDFDTWDLDALADYIVETHHKYSEEQSLKIKHNLEKMIDKEGDPHPELLEIRDIFKTASGDMASHMKKEELILFPFIKRVLKAKENNTKIEAPSSRMENPINMMIHDHNDQMEGFKKIRNLTDNYTPPAGVSDLYNRTFVLLEQLQQDLFKHIHLENNILFPKAIALGRKWTTA